MQITNNFIFFQATKEQATAMNAIWVQSKQLWKIPNTLGALRELYQVTKDEHLLQYGKEKRSKHEQSLSLKRLDHAPGDERLRPYQKTDVNFLSSLDYAGIFLEQRCGKSPVALITIEEQQLKKNLIVCPASLTIMWETEITKWTNKPSFRVKGTKKERLKIYQSFKEAESGYLIISKETLREDVSTIEAL